MLRIPFTAHKSNNEFFTMRGNRQLLLLIVKQRQVEWFGHVIRGDGLERLLVEGKLNGKSERKTWNLMDG